MSVRSVEVLTLLASAGRPVPAAMIARECGIPRSSTYAIVNELVDAGFAEPADGGFRAGPRARELGGGVTVGGALAVLESFDQGVTHLSPAELCRRSGLPLVRVEPVLDDLIDAGLLDETEDGRVALGVRLAALAARSAPLHRLRAAARPVLADLRDDTGETANLVVRDGDDGVYLDQVESPHALRHAGWAGRRIPLDRGAAARALTERRVEVRVARDAVEVGVMAVACRVPGDHDPAAAVSVTAPTARMTKRRLNGCRAAVREAAQRLAEVLG